MTNQSRSPVDVPPPPPPSTFDNAAGQPWAFLGSGSMQMDEDPASTPSGQVPYSRSFSVRLEGSGFSRSGSEGPSLGVLRVSEIAETGDDAGSGTPRSTDLPTIRFVFPESPRRAAKQPLSSFEASTKGLGPLEAFQKAQHREAAAQGTSSSSPSSSSANLARSLTRILSPRPLQPPTHHPYLTGHWSSPSLLTGASTEDSNSYHFPPLTTSRTSQPQPHLARQQSHFSSWGTSTYSSPAPLSPPPVDLTPVVETHAAERDRYLPPSLSPDETRRRTTSAPPML
ncbi:hypothetical protein JCM1840_004085 [Sporobolomyces johnsonii]